MVTLSYAKRGVKPLGVIVGYSDSFNMVKWINGDKHDYKEGGYYDTTLIVLSEAGKHEEV